jgi:hypothetical protein
MDSFLQRCHLAG